MKRVLILGGFVFFGFLVILALPNFFRSGHLPQPTGWETYEVRRGDTISYLAQKITSNQPDEYNLLEVVFLIAEKNNFKEPGHIILPGQKLLLPIFGLSQKKPIRTQSPSRLFFCIVTCYLAIAR